MNNVFPILRIKHAKDDMPLSRHAHPACELIFIKRGSIRARIGQKEYTAGAGSLILIGALEQHEIQITERPYERYFCIFPPQVLEQPGISPLLGTVFKNRPLHFTHCLPLKQAEHFEQIFSEMEKEHRNAKPLSTELSVNLLEQLLLRLYREHPEQFFHPSDETTSKIWEMQQYIEAHYCESLSIKELAENRFLNADYAGRLFKKLTGYTPKQYLLEYRLLHSRQLLLQEGGSVASVAARCGFHDVNHFIRTFRNHYGITPKQFQKRNF